MKALIIDDEPPVITVVKLLVNWKKYQIDTVFECVSAEQAMEVLESEKPEIILSDINLPGLSGLELMEKLRDEGCVAQVIFISAYDRFSYVQKAMQLDSVEYLLKPIERESVNRAVEKAVNRYRETVGRREDAERLQAQNLFTVYMSSGRKPEIFDAFRSVLSWEKERTNRNCRIGVVSLRHLSGENIALYPIQAAAQEFLWRNHAGTAAVWGDSADIALFFSDGEEEKVRTACLQLLSEIKKRFGLVLHAGISGTVPTPDGIEEAYREALELAVSANLFCAEESVEFRLTPVPPATSILWIEKVLFPVLDERNEERLRNTAAELSGHLERAGIVTIRQLENFRTMYNSQRSKWILAKQKERGETVLLPQDFRASFCLPDGRFSKEHFNGVLCSDLRSIREKFHPENEAGSTRELCRRAQEILKENYAEDISLEEMARRLGISQSYLSRTFKKEIGENLIDYLTRIRTDAAAELIKKGMRTADVAAAVGIPDPKYFSRVFKKVKGMSPSVYREYMKGGRS
ncbi:MAG: response regulator [Bacillota bacterium]|nr:response regulator [Bacillota bacterium]